MEYRFGPYTLDLRGGELRGPDGAVPLRRQTFRLLEVLVCEAPALIDRDVLIDRVWGHDALSRNVLPQAISELRQALGDDPAQPRYIETRHRRGYRFIGIPDAAATASTAQAAVESAPASVQPMPSAHPVARRIHPGWLVALALPLLLVFAWWMLTSQRDADPALEATRARLQAAITAAADQPAQALPALQALLELEPDNHALRLRLAETQLELLQGKAARRTLEGVGDVAPSSTGQRLAARLARLDGRTADAEALSAQAVVLAGKDPDLLLAALHEQVAALRAGGKLQEAEQLVLQLVKQHADTLGSQRALDLDIERLALLRERGAVAEAREHAAALQRTELPAVLRLRHAIESALIESEAGDQVAAKALLEAIQPSADLPPRWALALDNAWAVVLARAGDFDAALQRFESGFANARSRGAGVELAGMEVNAGLLFARQRRMEEAEALWNNALQTFEALGDRRGQGVVLGNLAAAASARGQQQRSEELNRRALAIFRELALDGPRARTAYNLGLALARNGALSEADALMIEAAEAYTRLGQADPWLHISAIRAELLLQAGELVAAEALLDAAGDGDGAGAESRAHLLAASARLAQWRGDIDMAREKHGQALALRAASGQPRWAAQSELDLLRLDFLDNADPVETRVAAEELAERFARWNEARPEARAHALAAEALIVQGRLPEARESLTRARDAAARFADVALDLELAWVEAWAGHPAEFEPRLRALAGRAERHGLRGRRNQALWALEIGSLRAPDTQAELLVRHQPLEPLPPYAASRGR